MRGGKYTGEDMNSIPRMQSSMADKSTSFTPWITFGVALAGWVLMLGIIVAGVASIMMGSQGFPMDMLFMMVTLLATAATSITTLAAHLLGSTRCWQVLRSAGHKTRHTFMLVFHLIGGSLILSSLLVVLIEQL